MSSSMSNKSAIFVKLKIKIKFSIKSFMINILKCKFEFNINGIKTVLIVHKKLT